MTSLSAASPGDQVADKPLRRARSRNVSFSLAVASCFSRSTRSTSIAPRLTDDNSNASSVIMVRTQVSFDEQSYRQAQAEARRLGISFAELCRRGIAQLARHKSADAPWMRFAGVLASGDPNASQTVDDVVYSRPEP